MIDMKTNNKIYNEEYTFLYETTLSNINDIIYVTEGDIYLVEFSIGESLKEFKNKLVKAAKDLWNNIKKVFKKVPKEETQMVVELQSIADNTEEVIEEIKDLDEDSDSTEKRNELSDDLKTCGNKFKSFCSKLKDKYEKYKVKREERLDRKAEEFKRRQARRAPKIEAKIQKQKLIAMRRLNQSLLMHNMDQGSKALASSLDTAKDIKKIIDIKGRLI